VESRPILDLSAARMFFDAAVGPVRLDHAEGVAVHEDGSVWCGGEAGQVYRIAPDGSTIERRVDDRDGFTLALAFGPDGLLYYVDSARLAIMRLDPSGGEPDVRRPVDRRPSLAIPNAIAFDAGDASISPSHSPTEPGPGVYRIDPDGTARSGATGRSCLRTV
jgi:sugar lactone lactonase YvrE